MLTEQGFTVEEKPIPEPEEKIQNEPETNAPSGATVEELKTDDGEGKDQETHKEVVRTDEYVCSACGKDLGSHAAFRLPDGTFMHLLCSGLPKKDWARALGFTPRGDRGPNRKLANIDLVEGWSAKMSTSKGFRDNEGNESDFLRCKIGEDEAECISRLSEEGWYCSNSNATMTLDGDGKPILKPK
jgi:hypothetical protein